MPRVRALSPLLLAERAVAIGEIVDLDEAEAALLARGLAVEIVAPRLSGGDVEAGSTALPPASPAAAAYLPAAAGTLDAGADEAAAPEADETSEATDARPRGRRR